MAPCALAAPTAHASTHGLVHEAGKTSGDSCGLRTARSPASLPPDSDRRRRRRQTGASRAGGHHRPTPARRQQPISHPGVSHCHRHSWYFQALFASVIRRTRARSGFLTAGASPCPDCTGPRSRISLPRARAEHPFRCGPSMHTPRQAIVAASSQIYCQGLLNCREAARPGKLGCPEGAIRRMDRVPILARDRQSGATPRATIT